MPDLSVNIPPYVFYGSPLSVFLRIDKRTLSNFKFSFTLALLKQIKKGMTQHPPVFNSFSVSKLQI